VSDAKAEPDGKAGLDAKADADGESVSGGGEKVVAGAAAVAAAAVTTDAKAATEPDAASDTESDAEPDTKSAAQPAADSEAPTGEHAAPAGPSTDADAAAGQREQVADEDPPAEQPASEAPAAAEAAEAPAAEVPAAEAPAAEVPAAAVPAAAAPAAEAPAAEVPAAEAPAAEAPATAAEAPANAEAGAPSPAPPRATPVRIEPTPGRWPASEPPTPRRDKRKLVLAGAALVVLLGLGGWVLTLAHGSLKNVPEIIAPTPPKVTLAYQPGDGTTPVSPTTPVSVTATDGVLREVALTVAGGTPIKGELSPDRRTWTVSQPLAYGKTYTWAGTASDVDDPAKTVPIAGTVTTVKPKKTIRGTINIGDGRVVGIAAPIEIQFNGHVTDRASVERALKVDTSVPTVGGWAWFQDEGGGSRIRWRPQSYWQPGTKVTVTAPMFGVDYGAGSWGAANISTSFTIGRSQITKADVNSHQLVVYRDGRQVFNFPASYGLGSDPNRNTRNGIHVVSEKFTDKRMVNPRYGYDVMEKFAVRISNNGEFIHANPQTVGVQGSRNITHGCVNLSLANAKQYFDSAMYGDPVEVTGSPIPLSARDGDIWDWTLDWDQWTRLSALNGS
jgi:lipoprotein-anchoring transpeptidase ErfK/SrfK